MESNRQGDVISLRNRKKIISYYPFANAKLGIFFILIKILLLKLVYICLLLSQTRSPPRPDLLLSPQARSCILPRGGSRRGLAQHRHSLQSQIVSVIIDCIERNDVDSQRSANPFFGIPDFNFAEVLKRSSDRRVQSLAFHKQPQAFHLSAYP